MMRNIHTRRTSAAADAGRYSRIPISAVRRVSQGHGRGKKQASPHLSTRGRLVEIPARNFLRRRDLTEGCSTSSLSEKFPASQPQAWSSSNGREPLSISLRTLEQLWLTQNQTHYAGRWVALEGARLVAQGSSARQVLEAARAEGYEQPLVMHIPKEAELPFGGW
jgi:hypothetical protein